MEGLAELRRWYAEDLRYVAPVRGSNAVVRAFATVPRERFVGPGPWKLIPVGRKPWVTEDADPAHLYHNVLVVIDEARSLNNGEPRLWAFLYDQMAIAASERVLHVGAGTGYYSAILAEAVGSTGRVTAVEYDHDLAALARDNLAGWPQSTVVQGDGAEHDPGAVDVIIVNAGCTHPAPLWLDALRPGGRLLIPLTTDTRWGAFLKVVRRPAGFAAEFVSPVGIFPCASCRDPAASLRLQEALRGSSRQLPEVGSLHRHGDRLPDETCWYDGPGIWISTAPLPDDA